MGRAEIDADQVAFGNQRPLVTGKWPTDGRRPLVGVLVGVCDALRGLIVRVNS
jgi:hypothetical protein